MTKTIQIGFVVLAIVYLGLTFTYKTADPRDLYYFALNKPIVYDSLVFIKYYSVMEVNDHGGSNVVPGKSRLPNSWLDTMWSYSLETTCRYNLNQPIYFKSASLHDDGTNQQYPFTMNVHLINKSGEVHANNFVKGKSRFILRVGVPFHIDDVARTTIDSLIGRDWAGRKFKIVVKTSMGDFYIIPNAYRVENLYNKITHGS